LIYENEGISYKPRINLGTRQWTVLHFLIQGDFPLFTNAAAADAGDDFEGTE
jgi:hypothetical protein